MSQNPPPLSPGTPPLAARLRRPWKVLVVDDDAEIHSVSRLVLEDCEVDGRALLLLDARSAEQARQTLQEHPDVALMLLDVVMETEHAGLDLVRHVREVLHNRAMRIVLRTGQPGQAPPLQMVTRYEIDDYRSKTELTFERLRILVISALRAYRQVSALLEANRELEQFAYAVSHDLQTPLRGILGMAELLRRRVPAGDGESAELIEHLQQSGRDLHGLITSLLQYSRLGRDAAPEEPVQLRGVLTRVLARLAPIVRERDAAISVGELPALVGVPVQLEQLFANLIENGIKYQPGARPVVSVAATSQVDVWEIRVSDRGIGIAPEHLQSIFEPFTRLQTRAEVAGSGIGLAICRKVVQLHGGTLHAESTPGAGTTMVIRLPALPGASPEPESRQVAWRVRR